MTITNKLAASLVAGSLGSLAQAAPITVSDTITLGGLLNNQSTTIHYDATNLLAGQGLALGEVQSGSLVVYGLSDVSYQTSADPYGAYFTSGTSQRTVSVPQTYYSWVYVPGYSYSCGTWGWSTCYSGGYSYQVANTYYYNMGVTDYNLTRQRDIVHRDTQDTMTVSVGASTGSVQDNVVAHSVGAYGQQNYEYVTGGGYNSTYTYYNQQRDVYDSISGPLELAISLDEVALKHLRETGFIDIVVAAAGQFSLQSIGATLTGEADGSDVPEPASMALALTGIAALAATRRKKKPGQ